MFERAPASFVLSLSHQFYVYFWSLYLGSKVYRDGKWVGWRLGVGSGNDCNWNSNPGLRGLLNTAWWGRPLLVVLVLPILHPLSFDLYSYCVHLYFSCVFMKDFLCILFNSIFHIFFQSFCCLPLVQCPSTACSWRLKQSHIAPVQTSAHPAARSQHTRCIMGRSACIVSGGQLTNVI